MKFITRVIAVITPKQPFIDWANGVYDQRPKLTLEDARGNPFEVILPEYERRKGRLRYVRKNFLFLFEDILAGWCRDPGSWPAARTPELFREWFDVSFYEKFYAAGDEEITFEKLD